jgi:hypothetical protein
MKRVKWAVMTVTKSGKTEVTMGYKKTMKTRYRIEKGSTLLRSVLLLRVRKQWPKKAKAARKAA